MAMIDPKKLEHAVERHEIAEKIKQSRNSDKDSEAKNKEIAELLLEKEETQTGKINIPVLKPELKELIKDGSVKRLSSEVKDFLEERGLKDSEQRLIDWLNIFETTGVEYLEDFTDNLDHQGVVAELVAYIGEDNYKGSRSRGGYRVGFFVDLFADGTANYNIDHETTNDGNQIELLKEFDDGVVHGTWEEVFEKVKKDGEKRKQLIGEPNELIKEMLGDE